MRLGRIELGPGVMILILLVMAGLIYKGLQSFDLLPQSIKDKINPPGKNVGYQIPEKPEKIEDFKNIKVPASDVKAPERNTDTTLVVQNDTSEQIKALAAGQMQLVTTTGDQAAVDIAGANKLLRGNKAKVIWSGGYSFGEDCIMGPKSWKADPQRACGAVVVTAVPYCDWNVTVDWAGDNQIP